MSYSRRIPLVLWATILAAATSSVRAEDAGQNTADSSQGPRFLRVVEDEDGDPVAMETSIIRYEPAGQEQPGLSVDLISAVHIGEKSYYQQLNEAFEEYDVLLYELVAPPGTRVPRGGGERSGHPVAAIQHGMTDMLQLAHQLMEVDYTKPNFVHADMSPEQFARSMEERGESFWGLFFKAMGQGLVMQSKDGGASDYQMMMALFDDNRALKLRRVMAKQFENLDKMMEVLNGPDGTTLITERNKAALAVLRKQMDAGKKRIGIFYGAGHMPDMDERLREEFGLKPTGSRWLAAWDLKGEEKSEEPSAAVGASE